jgi:hypothetical protein
MKFARIFFGIGVGLIILCYLALVAVSIWIERGIISRLAYLAVLSTAGLLALLVLWLEFRLGVRHQELLDEPKATEATTETEDRTRILRTMERVEKGLQSVQQHLKSEFSDLKKEFRELASVAESLDRHLKDAIQQHHKRPETDRTGISLPPVAGPKPGSAFANAHEAMTDWWMSNEKKVNSILTANREGSSILSEIGRYFRGAGVPGDCIERLGDSSLIKVSMASAGFPDHWILLPLLYFPISGRYMRFFQGNKERPQSIVRPALIMIEGGEDDVSLIERGDLI